jgi:hypothetical protein
MAKLHEKTKMCDESTVIMTGSACGDIIEKLKIHANKEVRPCHPKNGFHRAYSWASWGGSFFLLLSSFLTLS